MIDTNMLSTILNITYDNVIEFVLETMQSYSKARMPERDEFTAALFGLLRTLYGYDFEDEGSFTRQGAQQALWEEGGPWVRQLAFGFYVTGRFERLEEGEVDFRWIWDTWLIDAVNDPSKVGWWRSRGVSAKDIETLKNGPPSTTEPRPYIGNAMEGYSDFFAEQLDQNITHQLGGRLG